jgi:hypothetical protein
LTRLQETLGGWEVNLDDVPEDARAIIREIRGFYGTSLRVLISNQLTDAQRAVALVALLRCASIAIVPDLAVSAVFRAERDWGLGSSHPYYRAAIEEAVVRDVARRVLP